ncbi:hypothetical protein AB0D89_32900 [Streptomyces luteogriseus]|uniref:hypothetical protein n=1 Tax=Streptomyces luteogriseus TaxID=68233 RepID=UPI0033D983DB
MGQGLDFAEIGRPDRHGPVPGVMQMEGHGLMEWGDAPGWGALLFSAAALWVSLKAQKDGKRAADVAEATLARQIAAEEEAARPRVDLRLEHEVKDAYRLRNDGAAPARNVVFKDQELPYIFGLKGNEEVSLEQGEAVAFLMAGSIPPQLFAQWDGQEEWVPVRVPPKG